MPLTRPPGILALLAAGLLALGWLLELSRPLPLAAAPAVQAQPSPSPTAREEPRGRPTPSTDELERRKLRNEVDLLDLQKDQLRQQLAIEEQAWRAPAEAISKVGPTLVGLGLLYLLARALSHWLPARPAQARPTDPYDEEEDEL